MDNPFPGMDPWMEDQWGDAHASLITYARDQLRERLPSGLRARIQERVFLETAVGEGRNLYPDLRVIERVASRQPTRGSPAATQGGTAIAEPLIIDLADEPVTQGYIEIQDPKSGNRVVTIIELLSPANKHPGEGQRLYRQKQQECLATGVNLVEIDLLRGGQRAQAVPEDRVPASHRTPYRVCVWRASRPLSAELYRVPLREPLPAVRVPLRESDGDAVLELQPLLNRAYQNGDYDDTNYDLDPVPPLSSDDAAWAVQILREKGLRK